MLNQCNFIGRLGATPDGRTTQSGKQVANFRIACSEKFGGNETTEWVSCVAWDKLAEICQNYLSKGSLVFISGRMQTRKWQDKSGNDRYSTEIVVRDMKMLDSKQQDSGDRGGNIPASMGQDVPFSPVF